MFAFVSEMTGNEKGEVRSPTMVTRTTTDLGRHIRVASQREWIRTNVHNRGQAPAAPAPAGGGPASPAEAPTGVARAGGAGHGKRSGNPG
jgi:hypothetical protein